MHVLSLFANDADVAGKEVAHSRMTSFNVVRSSDYCFGDNWATDCYMSKSPIDRTSLPIVSYPTQLPMFDPSYPELLSSFYVPSSLSDLDEKTGVRPRSRVTLPIMSLSSLKNAFSKRYSVVPEKTAADLSEKPFDLESTGSDISESSTLATSEKTSSRIDSRVVSDAIIGLSDGLTVPFALTAGLSALGDTKVVIYGGLAELIAGAISMGLGGYLGAKNEEYASKCSRRTHGCADNATQGVIPRHTERDT